MKNPGRIVLLAIVLIAIGVGTRGMFDPKSGPRSGIVGLTVHLGVMVAEGTLLGIWGGLGTSSPGRRLLGVPLGLAWLWGVLTVQLWGEMVRELEVFLAFASLFILPTMAIVGTMLCIRWRQAQLCNIRDTGPAMTDEGSQFGIRHILIATTVAAVLVTMGKAMRGYFHQARHVDILFTVVLFAALIGIGYLAIAVTSVWACLGLGRIWPRIALVCCVALCVIVLPMWIVPFDKEGLVIYPASLAIQTAIVVGSLLFVRSGGVRLVSLKQLGKIALRNQTIATATDAVAVAAIDGLVDGEGKR